MPIFCNFWILNWIIFTVLICDTFLKRRTELFCPYIRCMSSTMCDMILLIKEIKTSWKWCSYEKEIPAHYSYHRFIGKFRGIVNLNWKLALSFTSLKWLNMIWYGTFSLLTEFFFKWHEALLQPISNNCEIMLM